MVTVAPVSGNLFDTVNAVTGTLGGTSAGTTRGALVHAATSMGGFAGFGAMSGSGGPPAPGSRSGGPAGQSTTLPNTRTQSVPCTVVTLAMPTPFHAPFSRFALWEGELFHATTAPIAVPVPRTRFSPTAVPG